MKNDLRVLMIGPARDVKGGMTSVVNNYFDYGLDEQINLKYIETINDKGKIAKIIKEIMGKLQFLNEIRNYNIIHIHIASRRSTYRKIKYIKISKKFNKKILLHIHGAEFKEFYNNECSNKQKEYIRNNFNLADKVIVLSEEWKNYFKNIIDENKIEVLYNSIVMPNDFEKNLDNQKILFLGRFGKRKGIYDLIDVLEKLCNQYPEIKLYAGGDGKVDKVKEIVKEKKLGKNVKILGWVTGKKKEYYLKECSLYILPSYNEGMPMSLIEGMAYKNIPISTNVGGIPKVIDNLENGIIVNSGNQEELYNAIETVLNDSKLRKKLSVNARKTVEEKFNIKNNIKKLINIYYAL